jgi:hypothetical protein
MMNAKTLSSMIRTFTEAFSFNHSASENPDNWNEKKLNKWFHKGEWRLEWNIIPDESINKTELAIQFFKNRELWEKAFNFLKTSTLKKIGIGKYELEGKDLYVIVDEYTTWNEKDSNFKSLLQER